MKRILLAGVALIGGTTIASAEAIDGRWVVDIGGCEYPTGVVAIDTAAARIDFYRTPCVMRDFAAMGTYDQGWTATLDCTYDDGVSTEDVVFGFSPADGERPDLLTILYPSDGYTTVYQRCP